MAKRTPRRWVGRRGRAPVSLVEAPSGDGDAARATKRTFPERFPFLRAESAVPTYLGIVLVIGGLGLIGYTWARVAGLILVPLQLPYIVSAGLTGLGLILVGAVAVSIQAKRHDAAAENRRLDKLAALLEELGRAPAAPAKRRTARRKSS